MPRQLHRFLLVIASLSFFSSVTFGQTPTAQQIEQFKRLPRAQQEQLARQMGVDLNSLSGFSGQTQSENPNTIQRSTYPRGTQFDEFGNPLTDQEPLELLEEEEEEELKLYGTELFANSPSTFAPVDDVPVPANYLIGPGDELRVQLYGKENEDYLLSVNRDGTLVIPRLGPFEIASMTFSEAKTYLREQVRKQVIGVEVSITMGGLRTMRIFVMGEAHKPGAYNVSSLSTITHALFVSGGVSDIASLRNIQLKRSGNLVTTLDLYDLLNKGDSQNDVQLQAGDVVFVPAVEKTVTVDGQVRRPAIYELKDEQNLKEVLALAGGRLPEGFAEAISVQRFLGGVQMQITANLAKDNPKVLNGDVITVPKVSPVVANSITLMGAVARPGKYQWRAGMRLSELVGESQKDLLEDADLSYSLILRDKNFNRDIIVLQTDLRMLQADPKNHDLILQNNDKILVFSKVEAEVFGDINLDDLAFDKEQLEENEKEAWEKRIEERLFWRSVGVDKSEDDEDLDPDDPLVALQADSIIELSETERERVLEFRDATFFSRKRMLVPVIAKLREQAKYGEPIQLVEVAGEVKVPGVYPLAVNATISSAVKAAGGLTESSYPLKSEVTRTIVNQSGVAEVNHLEFSPLDVLRGNGDDYKLVSRDRVNVFSVPSWQDELKVQILGEVEFPGEYTIRRGEKMSDLVARAGGLTDYGDAEAAIFTRESLKEQEVENLRKLTEELRKQIASESLRRQSGAGSIVSYDEARKLLRDLTKAEAVGRLVIDLPDLLAGESVTDVILENGDTLYIPGRSQSVNVIGEVYVPTSHLFSTGLSYEDYILKSGGYRSLADKGSTYIIRANGSVEVPGRDSGFWFNSGDSASAIMPGDTIVVPFDADNVDNMTLWASATQIIYQLAVAVAAIGSL